MPRFVVLRHDSPRGLHWDLMLEAGPVLKTWALGGEPCRDALITAEALADHRPAYLDYEGPLSAQRGSVLRWDQGSYTVARQNESEWVILAAGERLQGQVRLARLPDQPGGWQFVWS
jgi:hypothetical protein